MIIKSNIPAPVLYGVYTSAASCLVSLVITRDLIASVVICAIVLVLVLFSKNGFYKLENKSSVSNARPAVIWLTGLSGSGKTTIANCLAKELQEKFVKPILLDGDEVRNLFKQHGFDEDARKNHNLNIGYMASLLEKQGNIVIVSLISPYGETRDAVRNICSNFIEVYVATGLDICIQRDPKGLYKRALAGEIKEFTGISAPYHAPLSPEITIDTARMTPVECSEKILSYLSK